MLQIVSEGHSQQYKHLLLLLETVLCDCSGQSILQLHSVLLNLNALCCPQEASQAPSVSHRHLPLCLFTLHFSHLKTAQQGTKLGSKVKFTSLRGVVPSYSLLSLAVSSPLLWKSSENWPLDLGDRLKSCDFIMVGWDLTSRENESTHKKATSVISRGCPE